MAKQKGPVYVTGTYNGICYYRLDGKYYARRKSSLSSKRVKKDKRFELTMVYAGLLGQASAIASRVYRRIPPAGRQHALYRKMTSIAMQLLKKGINAEEISAKLMADHVTKVVPVAKKVPVAKEKRSVKVSRIVLQQAKRKGVLYVAPSGVLCGEVVNGEVQAHRVSHRSSYCGHGGIVRAEP